jgi:pimeloyl-ACP methyl ester carboxylesterase
MKLFYRKYGEPGTPLIIVHGLYGSGDNWVTIARELSARFEVYVIDQRNHGQSPHSDTHNYPVLRDDLKMFMDAEGIDRAVLIGHSMGAKTIMYFAASWPDRVISLVSVDMAPRAYHELAVESRTAANHGGMIDAMLELELSGMKSREEIDRALGVRIGSGRVRRFLLKNVQRDQGGAFYWRINLPALRNNLPRIMDGLLDSENEGLGGLEAIPPGGITGFPALFIAGEKSDYIRTEDHQLIRALFPGAQIVTIPGAGHWVHAEQPRLLVKTLDYFLDH